MKKSVLPIVFSLSILILLIPTPNSYATPGEVYFASFNAGVPAEFSGITTTDPVPPGFTAVGGFNGDFLRNTAANPPQPTTLTLTGLECHSSVLINFNLAIIDTWDGGSANGPDTFTVKLDGNIVFSEVFATTSGTQTYQQPVTIPGIELAFQQDLGFTGALDSAYNMSLEPAFFKIPHFGPSLTIDWVTLPTGWQGGTDESWAIDNVRIFLSGFDDPRCVDDNGDDMVGGELLPIDSTALLLAAAQSPAAWLSSLALVALGIGAFVFTRNPNNMRNIKVIFRDYLDRI